MKNQTNTNKYNLTNDVVKKEVDNILKGKYQQCVLGTLDQNGYPYLSKTLPLYYEKKIYLLLSDLSDHKENLKINKKVSIYFAQEEIHKERLNNPRLTLLGLIKKLKLNKNDEIFRKLLKNYIQNKMKMSHIYQPVMIKSLINNNGRNNSKNIAKEILS